MKRDWQLIKALMLEIESCEQGRYFVPQAFAGHDLESVKYHLHLLDQAGLVEQERQPRPTPLLTHLAGAARETLRRIA
jgi:hypothetical protein